MTKKPIRFKNKESYRRWLAYGNIHGDFARVPGHQKIMIAGRPHKVHHTRR